MVAGHMDRQTDRPTEGQTDGTYRFPLYSTGLAYITTTINYEILEQGKGTNDHLLPFGDWLTELHQPEHQTFCKPYLMMVLNEI